jgi:hypothetical protein
MNTRLDSTEHLHRLPILSMLHFLSDSDHSFPGSGLPLLAREDTFSNFEACSVCQAKDYMKGKLRIIITLLGTLVALLAWAVESPAQSHEGFIYGKVYTGRNTYEGPIRWGTEEVLWTDIFNAAKTDDTYEKLIPEKSDNGESWDKFTWNFGSIWENVSSHQFTSQFGNFKEMRMSSHGNVLIKLKNGGSIEVKDDGNDIGEKIQVIDPDLGAINISWDNIDRIEFLPTPARLPVTFGLPLYGTVEGERNEKFTGFIVWDNDERLTVDKLDGDSEDGDVSLRFGEITSIRKRGSGSEVVLKSGREFYLRGSNDVNDENRGVMVVVPGIGVVSFSWDAFSKVTFTTPDNTGPSFDSFKAPAFRSGTVKQLNDSQVSGRIIYDVDEALDFEIIEGKENGIEYFIRLKDIKKVTPRNADYSMVELVSGKSLLLGDGRDVSENNAGVLVFVKGKKDPVYIPWRRIDQIIFD